MTSSEEKTKDGNGDYSQLAASTTYTYDVKGNQITESETRGSTQTVTTNDYTVDSMLSGTTKYSYDEFGQTTVDGDYTFENEICYTGGIYDWSTGQYYLNARYYDPETGRFLSEDTYRGDVNEPNTLHLYAYCANNPVNYVDPSGHLAKVTPYIARNGNTKKVELYLRYASTSFVFSIRFKELVAESCILGINYRVINPAGNKYKTCKVVGGLEGYCKICKFNIPVSKDHAVVRVKHLQIDCQNSGWVELINISGAWPIEDRR